MRDLQCRRAIPNDAAAIGALIPSQHNNHTTANTQQQQQAVLHLIHTHLLTLVVQDDTGTILACGSFNDQPSLVAEHPQYTPEHWSEWLAEQLSLPRTMCVPGLTVFITHVSESALTHTKTEKRAADLLMSTAFHTMRGVQCILRLCPNNIQQQCQKSALRHALQPVSVSPSSPLGSLYSVFQCSRSSYDPALFIRFSRLEDHDELTQVLTQQHISNRQQPHKITQTTTQPTDTQTESGTDSYLTAILSTTTNSTETQQHAHPLVAERDGQAVGLMTLTCDVELHRLLQVFELDHFQRPFTQIHNLTETQFQQVEQAKTEYRRNVQQLCMVLQEWGVQSSWWIDKTEAWVSTLTASDADKLKAWRESLPQECPSLSTPVLVLDWLLHTCSYLSIYVVHSTPINALVGQLLDHIVSSLTQAQQLRLMGMAASAEFLSDSCQSSSTNTHHHSSLLHADNVFGLSLFCLDDRYAERGIDFLLPAFQQFPDKDYLFVTLPTTRTPIPLLQHFTRITPRLLFDETTSPYPDALYVLHRYTALAIYNHKIQVRPAQVTDLPGLHSLLYTQPQYKEQVQQLEQLITNNNTQTEEDKNNNNNHQVAATPAASTVLMLDVASEVAGVAVVQDWSSTQHLTSLSREYALQCGQDPTLIASSYANLSLFYINPLFLNQTAFILQQCLRWTGKQVLQYRAYPEGNSADNSNSNNGSGTSDLMVSALLSVMKQARPRRVPSPPTSTVLTEALVYPSATRPATVQHASDSRVQTPAKYNKPAARKTADKDPQVGPLASLKHLALNRSTSLRLTDHAASHSPTEPSDHAFALYEFSRSLLYTGPTAINDRIVLIGASQTALACLETLFFQNQHLLATSLTLIDTSGMKQQLSTDNATAFLPTDLHYTKRALLRLALKMRVRVIEATVIKIDREQQWIYISTQETPIPYDQLLLTAGRQTQCPAIKVLPPPVVITMAADELSFALPATATGGSVIDPASTPPPLALDTMQVIGVLPLSHPGHVHSLLQHVVHLHQSAASGPTTSPDIWLVYGTTLRAVTCIRGLLELGIQGKHIIWAHQAAIRTEEQQPDPLASTVFGDNQSLCTQVLHCLEKFQIRVIPAVTITEVHTRMHVQQSDNADVTIMPYSLASVVLSNGQSISCHSLCLCTAVDVDSTLYSCLLSAGLVYDGRLVVDHGFQTHDPHISAAGPIAKFQNIYASYKASHPAEKSSAYTRLMHEKYSSIEIGQRVAEVLIQRLMEQHNNTGKKQQQQLSEETEVKVVSKHKLLPKLGAQPCIVSAYLPGDLYYFQTSQPFSPPPATGHTVLAQSFPSHSVQLSINPNLSIDQWSYVGLFSIPTFNLVQLIGLPITYCNQLLNRWSKKSIISLLLFFQQPWASFLYTETFAAFRHQLTQQLTQSHGESMSPVIEKLHGFQTRLQEYVQQNPGHNTEMPADELNALDPSILSSVATYLPAQVRDIAHKEFLRFITQNTQELSHYPVHQ